MSEIKHMLNMILITIVALATITMLPILAHTMFTTSNGITGTSPTPQDTPAPQPAPPPEPTDWTTILTVVGAVLAVVLALGLLLLARHSIAKRRRDRQKQQRRRSAQIELWQQGVKILTETSDALIAFETDPDAVYFTRRLLADVAEPATAAFYTAFSTAQNLRTETIPADTTMITAFVDAASTARTAFGVADENARRKARLGISHNDHRLTSEERRKIDQAQKLMRQAHDPVVPDENAHNALAKALSLLDDAGVIVPERLTSNVTKSIQTIHRRALTR